ncbi:MAG: sporulation protein YyaC [Clostridia bacterium]|jgi:putative sporulation protein YyaC|nr:sporulation protein YyaC [Clostridia bacterium]
MLNVKFEKSIDIHKQFAFSYFSAYFEECFSKLYNDSHDEVVFVCIGTDRATGDCLGPLIGYNIQDMNYKRVHVLGTLDNPVHAKNLEEHLKELKCYQNPFIVAIDASLGKFERIGFVNIKEGPLSPGSGVNKSLPQVGDMHITGIVNMSGFMEIMVLQNTRLSLVMNMANIISKGIKYNMWKFQNKSQTHNAIQPQIDFTNNNEMLILNGEGR